ncbi:MAG: hypothetical protein Kow0088_15900 [Anaerolineales bacterium]
MPTRNRGVGVDEGVAVGVMLGVKVGRRVGVRVRVGDGEGVTVDVGVCVAIKGKDERLQKICVRAMNVVMIRVGERMDLK